MSFPVKRPQKCPRNLQIRVKNLLREQNPGRLDLECFQQGMMGRKLDCHLGCRHLELVQMDENQSQIDWYLKLQLNQVLQVRGFQQAIHRLFSVLKIIYVNVPEPWNFTKSKSSNCSNLIELWSSRTYMVVNAVQMRRMHFTFSR